MPLGVLRCRWEDNVKWIVRILAQGGVERRDLIDALMKPPIP
jgi:hypothetical protein